MPETRELQKFHRLGKEVESLLSELTPIREEMVAAPALAQSRLDEVHPNFQSSARNLLHYLALRRQHIRPLQLRLAKIGLSSLGRAESHVLATLDSVLLILHHLAEDTSVSDVSVEDDLDFAQGERLLAENTTRLFGPVTPERGVRMMVTMPSEAASDFVLVQSLLQQGMDCMRINCAHDDTVAWQQMITNLRRAEDALGRECKVFMDLAGPKLRTGPLEPGPAVVKIRPERDGLGNLLAPARIWLTSMDAEPPSPATVSLPVTEAWLSAIEVGDEIHFADARGARRVLTVEDRTEHGSWAECAKSAYLIPGIVLHLASDEEHAVTLTSIPSTENSIKLVPGDALLVTRDQHPGRPATRDSAGRILTPAMIGCTIPDVFADASPGESIWFDDGKIGGVMEKIEPSRVLVRITQCRLTGEKLRGDKGINLPETPMRLAAMTDKDKEDLKFVAKHAGAVELSFANTARDVEELHEVLAEQGGDAPAIVLKIETRRGFDNLPDMLLTAMRAPCCGVMIARGDLAVECGFERLAEVQEEILWICEAAHIPVIWATQVLETLAKEGMPSRAEITDAAMGHRAECVMLNKGPHVVSAMRVLNDILRRMQAHQAKKRSMLRELRLAHWDLKDED